MDEFEIIGRCFRDRTVRRPDTVLGIGDDAALIDTGGAALAHAGATAPIPNDGDTAGTACRVFGAAFVRLAAQAVTPRWATLAITVQAGDPGRIESFAASAAAVCDACGVDLIGGDTTRGPGRATVFALGTKDAGSLHRAPRPPTAGVEACSGRSARSAGSIHRAPQPPTAGVEACSGRSARSAGSIHDAPRPPTTAVRVRLPLADLRAPERAIANLVSVCVDLAGRGAEIRCDDPQSPNGDARADALDLLVHTDAAGVDALRADAGRLRLETMRPGSHG